MRMKAPSTGCALLLALASSLVLSTGAHAAPGAFDLTSPANGAWSMATCKFTWQSASSAVSYDLYVDSDLKKAAIAAASPPTYTLLSAEALTDGWHTWYVVARDSGGTTTQSTSTFSVRADASPPTAPVLGTPAASDWTSSAAPTFTWAASADVGSGVAGYEIWINDQAVTTGLGAAVTSAQAAMPFTTVYQSSLGTSCSGWTLAKVSTSDYTWGCGHETVGGVGADAMYIHTYCASATTYSTATSGAINLSNVGNAELGLNESKCGSTMTYQVLLSDGSSSGFRLVRDTPASNCDRWASTRVSIDDYTGGTASSIMLDAWVPPCDQQVYVSSIQVRGVSGGLYTWQVVAIDQAGNRTPSESRPVRYDVPPLPFDLSTPADATWTANNKPALSWNATTDAGSGLAKYQLWVDGALSVDSIAVAATSSAPANALADGMHSWQIYAVDAAGAVRKSRQTWNIGIDTTPPSAFSLLSPADQSSTGIPTPTLSWSTATDAGSGVDHYQLFIDGSLARDSITGTQSTPTSTLAEGAHTWSVKAVDKMGNSRDSTQTWTIYVDFGTPPASFSLLTPANGSTVDTLTPTFTWQASSDTGGVSRYELRVDNACVACAIAATSTTYTLTTPLTAASHSWTVSAVDHAAHTTVATGAPWTFTARECAPDSTGPCSGNSTGACTPGTRTCSASGTWGACTGVVAPTTENCSNGIDDDCDGLVDCADPDCATVCGTGLDAGAEHGPESGPEVGPESGPEVGPEPSLDAGVVGSTDAGLDSPVMTTTGTSTATGTSTGTSTPTSTASSTGTVSGTTTTTTTLTSTGTGTAPTGTGTATATSVDASVGPELGPDASLRDGTTVDAPSVASDSPGASWAVDATGVAVFDGGSGPVDAMRGDALTGAAGDVALAKHDGSQLTAVDGSGVDLGASVKTGSSGGCGCTVGGARPAGAVFWPLAVVGLLALRRIRHCRSRRRAVTRLP